MKPSLQDEPKAPKKRRRENRSSISRRARLIIGGVAAAVIGTVAWANGNSFQSHETRNAAASAKASEPGSKVPTVIPAPVAEYRLDTHQSEPNLPHIEVPTVPDLDQETQKVLESIIARGLQPMTLKQLTEDLKGLTLRFADSSQNTIIASQVGTNLRNFPLAKVQLRISADGKVTVAGKEVKGYLPWKSPFSGIQALLEERKIAASRPYIGKTVDKERDKLANEGYRLTKTVTGDYVGLYEDKITYYMEGVKQETSKTSKGVTNKKRRRVVITFNIHTSIDPQIEQINHD